MAKQKYVAVNVVDNIGGDVVDVGKTVTLDEETAAPLVALGALAPAPGSKPTPGPAAQ